MSLRNLTLGILALFVIVSVLAVSPVQSPAQETTYANQPDARVAMRMVVSPIILAPPECPIPGSAGGGC